MEQRFVAWVIFPSPDETLSPHSKKDLLVRWWQGRIGGRLPLDHWGSSFWTESKFGFIAEKASLEPVAGKVVLRLECEGMFWGVAVESVGKLADK